MKGRTRLNAPIAEEAFLHIYHLYGNETVLFVSIAGEAVHAYLVRTVFVYIVLICFYLII